MIVRGTTPYHTFELPVLMEDIDVIWVTYYQNSQVVFECSNLVIDERMQLEPLYQQKNENIEGEPVEELVEEEPIGSQLTVHLTQEDTLGFTFYPAARKNTAYIQIRILTTDGEAYVSQPVHERVFGVFHEGVIGHDTEGE